MLLHGYTVLGPILGSLRVAASPHGWDLPPAPFVRQATTRAVHVKLIERPPGQQRIAVPSAVAIAARLATPEQVAAISSPDAEKLEAEARILRSGEEESRRIAAMQRPPSAFILSDILSSAQVLMGTTAGTVTRYIGPAGVALAAVAVAAVVIRRR